LRALLIHAEEFSFNAREKAIDGAEELQLREEQHFRNVLVVFVSVEEGDSKDADRLVDEATSDIIDVATKVKADHIVVYPYAHLSQRLAPPSEALMVLKLLEEKLKERWPRVTRAPFGWYKAFTLKCFGHPLSELSREYKPKAVQQRKVEKKYYILTPQGELFKPEEFDFSKASREFRVLVEKEYFKKEAEGAVSRAQMYMRKFGFEWEDLSDHGHMRYEPHAAVMVEAVAEYAWRVARELGIPVFRVKGTNMFSLKSDAIRTHTELFGERIYTVDMDGDRYILRFAACYQQFSILKDWPLSYKDLPLGMLEIADSYRYEQRGELVLGFRLRRFYMPDLHVLTKDLDEAKQIATKIRDKIVEEAAKIGRSYEAIYNVAEDFFETNKEYVLDLVRREGKSVLLVLYPPKIYYWVINVEYLIIDDVDRPREVATWQIDVGNAKRFGITYKNKNGEDVYPVIIHTAILGSIERYLYMVFDTVARNEAQGQPPTLPLWLSPIQVRVVPVSKEYLDYAMKVARALEEEGIRTDVDDRDESLGKKIRDAGIEWIPYVVVVGEREVKTNTINVRIRSSGIQKVMTLDELLATLRSELAGYPKISSALPLRLSQRPALPYLRPLESMMGSQDEKR